MNLVYNQLTNSETIIDNNYCVSLLQGYFAMHFSISIAKLRLTDGQHKLFSIIHTNAHYNKKSTILVLWRHGLPGYATSIKQSRFKCCEDGKKGFMLLLWWRPFKIKKGNLSIRYFINTDRLSLVSTLLPLVRQYL